MPVDLVQENSREEIVKSFDTSAKLVTLIHE